MGGVWVEVAGGIGVYCYVALEVAEVRVGSRRWGGRRWDSRVTLSTFGLKSKSENCQFWITMPSVGMFALQEKRRSHLNRAPSQDIPRD